MRRGQSCKDKREGFTTLREQQVYRYQGMNKLGMFTGKKEDHVARAG